MTHDECVGCWTPPPHHRKILPYNHQHLQPLSLPLIWSLVPDEGRGVQHPGDCLVFGPMAGSETHGLWHCVLSVFVIIMILLRMEWPTPDYHNSLVFMNETTKKVSQLPLRMKNIMFKRHHLTYMFSIGYGCFRDQLISC